MSKWRNKRKFGLEWWKKKTKVEDCVIKTTNDEILASFLFFYFCLFLGSLCMAIITTIFYNFIQ